MKLRYAWLLFFLLLAGCAINRPMYTRVITSPSGFVRSVHYGQVMFEQDDGMFYQLTFSDVHGDLPVWQGFHGQLVYEIQTWNIGRRFEKLVFLKAIHLPPDAGK